MPRSPRTVFESPLDRTDELATEFLASNLRLDVRRGHVTLMGHRIMLFRFEFLVGVQKQLEEAIGASAAGVLYRAGERAAEKVMPAMAREMKRLPSGQESLVALRRMSDVWATIGVGRAVVTAFDPGSGVFAFRIEDPSYAAAYGPSTKPVCHLWAGWAAGVAARLYGREVRGEEVRCAASGDPACEFLISPQG